MLFHKETGLYWDDFSEREKHRESARAVYAKNEQNNG